MPLSSATSPTSPLNETLPCASPTSALPNSASADDAPIEADAPDQLLLSVVVVSYNTRELTLRCLRELTEHLCAERLSHEIWVVDNASQDGSARAIEREFPDANLMMSNANLGFGPANNLALQHAQGRYLLLLNSDAFVHEGAISRLIELLDDPAKARVGAVGPRLLNEDGSLQRSCWKFPSPARSWFESLGLARLGWAHPQCSDYYRWAHDEQRSVDFVIGACLLVRREVYQEIGGFDPAFFLYAEETDWQKRMRGAGWDIVFRPDALVTHLGGSSGKAEKARVSTLFWQGQERYVLKHFGRRGWLVMRLGVIFGVAVRTAITLATALSRGGRKRAVPQLRAGLEHLWRLLRSGPPEYSAR